MKTIKNFFVTIMFLMTVVTANAYDFESNGLYYNIISMDSLTVNVTHGENKYSGDVIVPDTIHFLGRTLKVVEIAGSAFKDCTDLQSVKFGKNIKTIGNASFFNSGIKEVFIPQNVLNIGSWAFKECDNLQKIIIEDGNDELYIEHTSFEQVFSYSPVNSLYIGRNIKRDTFGFQGSVFNGFTAPALNVEIGPKVTYLTYFLLEGLKIKNLVIPNSVKEIYSSAIYNCTLLESVDLGNNVEKIGAEALSGCTSLTSIVLPKSLKEIGRQAFANNSKMLKVYNKNSNPIEINDDCFSSVVYWTGTLYVPQGSVEKYRTANGWKNFSSIKEDVSDDMATYYDLNVNVSSGGNLMVYNDTLSDESKSYILKEGDNVVFKAIPDNKYYIKSFVVNGEDKILELKNNEYSIPSLNMNTDIKVVFAENPIYITIKDASNGSISQEIEKNKSYSFIITPCEGWNLESVSFNGIDVTGQMVDNKFKTPAIVSNSEIIIVYMEDQYTSAKDIDNRDIKVTAHKGNVVIENDNTSKNAFIYDIKGNIVKSVFLNNGTNRIDLPMNNVYIIKVENMTFKVLL